MEEQWTPRETRVLLIGDSWLVQLAPEEPQDAPAAGDLLLEILGANGTGAAPERGGNRGARGSNTFDWRPGAALLRSAIANAPVSEYPWAFVALGINDSSEKYGAFAPETYGVQLEAIAAALAQSGYQVLLQSPPYIPPQGDNHTETGVARLRRYQTEIAAIAARDPGRVFDADLNGLLFAFTQEHPEVFGSDHVHLTAAGTRRIAAIWARNIAQTVARCEERS